MIKEKNQPWVLGLSNWDGKKFTPSLYHRTSAWEFLEIDMPDGTKEYYSTEVGDLNFSYDVARLAVATRGDKAHLYALERKVNATDPNELKLWGRVLNELDDMNGEANGKT